MQGTMPRLSIALATYNGQSFILEQLQSLAGQRRLPDELIVCDDQSTDRTIAIVREFAEGAPFPVRIQVNQTRLGYRKNFMMAASLCEGELVAFCDQDDIWHPDKLERVIEAFEDDATTLVYHNANIINSERQVTGKVRTDLTSQTEVSPPLGLSPWTFPLGFTMTFRRDLLKLSKFRPETIDYLNGSHELAHDQWIYLLSCIFGNTAELSEAVVDYRQHEANVFGLVKDNKSKLAGFAEKFNRFVNFDVYSLSCERIVSFLEAVSADGSLDEFHARADHAIGFFRHLSEMYTARYDTYSSPTMLARYTHWKALQTIRGYDPSAACRFGRSERGRDLLLGVVLGKLTSARHEGPSMDWSLKVGDV